MFHKIPQKDFISIYGNIAKIITRVITFDTSPVKHRKGAEHVRSGAKCSLLAGIKQSALLCTSGAKFSPMT